MSPDADVHDLERFVKAQVGVHERALAELTRGEKQTHWVWYIFPQLAGLGNSPNAVRYAIANLAEAEAYLQHAVLGARLVKCAEAVLGASGRTARDIMGQDDVKLRSSATLFARVSADGSVFHRLLERYFDGKPDPRTLELLGER